ncbi:hypothetical protein [Pollutibacter soli]|uniref:hypothetical protein n=1 Tax=Pollutibacter soli TaxID=3034157 RepID=UPI0030138661
MENLFPNFVNLKKALGILFFCIYLLSYGEGHQLLRMPYLVNHFQKHLLVNPEMTVVEFLRIHYIRPIQPTDDFQQDQQLPFRAIDSNLMSISQTSIEPMQMELPEISAPQQQFFSFNDDNPSFEKGYDIFQPPRIA